MTIDTRQSLINSAELMLRSRGYAAFSYADLEKIVGIKKPVFIIIFPKEDLGILIVETYIEQTIQDFEKSNVIFLMHSDAFVPLLPYLEAQCLKECYRYVELLLLKWLFYQRACRS